MVYGTHTQIFYAVINSIMNNHATIIILVKMKQFSNVFCWYYVLPLKCDHAFLEEQIIFFQKWEQILMGNQLLMGH